MLYKYYSLTNRDTFTHTSTREVIQTFDISNASTKKSIKNRLSLISIFDTIQRGDTLELVNSEEIFANLEQLLELIELSSKSKIKLIVSPEVVLDFSKANVTTKRIIDTIRLSQEIAKKTHGSTISIGLAEKFGNNEYAHGRQRKTKDDIPEEIIELLSQGFTFSRIAREYKERTGKSITRQTVAKYKKLLENE